MTSTNEQKAPRIAMVLKEFNDVHGGSVWIALDEVLLELFEPIAQGSTIKEVLVKLADQGYTEAYRYDVDEEQPVGENLFLVPELL